jgi:hypothetical protein
VPNYLAICKIGLKNTVPYLVTTGTVRYYIIENSTSAEKSETREVPVL